MKKLLSLSGSLVVGTALFMLMCTTANCSLLSNVVGDVLQPTKRPAYLIEKPEHFQEVQNSFTIKGRARANGVFINYRLRDDNGELLAAGYISVDPTLLGERREIEKEIIIQKQATAPQGMLEIFEKSTSDGSIVESILIPIQFKR